MNTTDLDTIVYNLRVQEAALDDAWLAARTEDPSRASEILTASKAVTAAIYAVQAISASETIPQR